MKRYAHYWWALKSTKYPARIAVFDATLSADARSANSEGSVQQLGSWRLIVLDYQHGERLRHITLAGDSVPSAWDAIAQLLTSKEKVLLFIPRALQVLDAMDWKGRLERGEMALAGKSWTDPPRANASGEDRVDALCILNDPPTLLLLSFPNRPGRLLILDTRNIGFEDIGHDHASAENCFRYAEGLDSVLSSLRESGSGALRATSGSQAVSILRTKYPVVRLHCHTDNNALRLERESLYGGRCECFRLGEIPGPVYHLDVRNMYPALCRTLPLPVSLRRYHATENSARDAAERCPNAVAAHARIKSPHPDYPVRRDGIVIYPTGEYDTCMCGPELENALKQDRISRWYCAAEYTLAPVLSGFMDHWLGELSKARLSGNGLLQSWIKRLMVSAVGKFSESCRRWLPSDICRTERGPYGEWQEVYNGEYTRFRNMAWRTMREEYHGESYWSIPAITAWVTAAGRMQLHAYLDCAGRGRTYYVDTDSLLVSESAYMDLSKQGFVGTGEPGYLRLLGIHQSASVYGFRHYSLSGIVTCSGYQRPLPGEGEREEEYRSRLLAESLRFRAGPSNKRAGAGTRRIGADYRHGTVLADGTVRPFEVNDGR